MTLFDLTHCYFQGVVAGVEIQLCLEALHRRRTSLIMIRSFAEAGWSQPVLQNTDASQLLSDIKERLTESAFKGMASESQ